MAQKNFQPHIAATIALVVFGGPAGVAAAAYDYLKRDHYSPSPPPDKNVIIKQIGLAIIFIILARSVLSGLALDLVVPGFGMLNDWFPTLTQGLVGLIITNRYLHKHNVYFTSQAMWQSVDWSTALTDLSEADFKDLIKNPTAATPSNTTAHPASPTQPASMSTSPLVVDQSGDALRVKLILFAVVILALVLAYQYLAKNPEQFIERINQVLEGYAETEK